MDCGYENAPWDFPGDPGAESTCQRREHGFGPWSWSGEILHVAGQLSSSTTTTEPAHPRTCALQQEKPPE